MRKSLIVIASALLLAVAAATHERLRYDSTVFADAGVSGGGSGPRAVRVEYPPCVRGVREDRCVQLYERGVRRSYQRFVERHGGGQRVATAAPSRARAYPACRNRNEDRCQQRSGVRRTHSRWVSRAASRRAAVRTARRAQPVRVVARPAVRRPAQRVAARPTMRRPVQRVVVTQRPVVRSPVTRSPAPRRPGGTPGI